MERRVGLLRRSELLGEEESLFVNRVEETFELEYHSHDFYEIAYVSGGRGFHHWGGRVVPVSKGDLFLLPIGLPHVFRPASADEGEKLAVYNCVFSESLLRKAAETIEDIDLFVMFEPEGKQIRDTRWMIEPLYQRMLEEYKGKSAGSSGMLFGLFLQLLVQLHRFICGMDVAGKPQNGDDPIQDAIDYIGRHAAENLTIRLLAERCGMSERHFFRLFKSRTGHSFLEYVQHTRIRMSCELLLGTRHKVGTVAEMAGYRDPQSFHQVFKKIVGMTPGDYRKKEGAVTLGQ
ncbi:helix-turn-helix domain-containing protein [Paenibacillus thalictri]|nr:AraC family transcriptional regulator [Paenibacillus thalictri]